MILQNPLNNKGPGATSRRVEGAAQPSQGWGDEGQ